MHKVNLLLHYNMVTNVANKVSNTDKIKIKKESVKKILNDGNHLPYFNIIITAYYKQFML